MKQISKERKLELQREIIEAYNKQITHEKYKNPEYINQLIKDDCMRYAAGCCMQVFESAVYHNGYSISTLPDGKLIVRAAE